jgi:hypothetical protein
MVNEVASSDYALGRKRKMERVQGILLFLVPARRVEEGRRQADQEKGEHLQEN